MSPRPPASRLRNRTKWQRRAARFKARGLNTRGQVRTNRIHPGLRGRALVRKDYDRLWHRFFAGDVVAERQVLLAEIDAAAAAIGASYEELPDKIKPAVLQLAQSLSRIRKQMVK